MQPQLRLPSPQVQKAILPNGLRVLTERLPHVSSASLGIWIASGSSDEPHGSEGMTHFLEHMLFKGTNSRSTLEIAEAIDDIGGNVNGFTDREAMYLYARTTGDQAEAALELLFDLLLHSVCAEDDVAREQAVVLQEIAHVEDIPEGWVHELLPQTAWAEHSLGRTPLGDRERVKGVTRDALLAHLARLHAADRLVVTAAGQVDHEHIVELAARHCGALKPASYDDNQEPPAFHPQRRVLIRPGVQVHFCLAAPGCARTDDRRHAFSLLDAILGGGNSSRLFQEIRERRGLAYNIGSYLQSYRQAGLFVIDASCGPESFHVVLDLIRQEMEQLHQQEPSEAELQRAKTQLKVALALAAEGTSFRMQHLAVSEIHWGRVLTFDEIIAGVERVTAEDVQGLADSVLKDDLQALVAIGPFDEQGET
jgi:predicted Zn-dependent peptidase